MNTSINITRLLPFVLSMCIAACDSNHDGDKGAVWGIDKQDASGSEISTGTKKPEKNYSDSISIRPADTSDIQAGYSRTNDSAGHHNTGKTGNTGNTGSTGNTGTTNKKNQ